MNRQKGGISLHLSGLAVVPIALAILRRVVNRALLSRAKSNYRQ